MRNEELDDKAIEIKEIQNYYGGLNISTHGDRFYWCVEGYSGFDWKEIPESLYVEILKHKNGELI